MSFESDQHDENCLLLQCCYLMNPSFVRTQEREPLNLVGGSKVDVPRRSRKLSMQEKCRPSVGRMYHFAVRGGALIELFEWSCSSQTKS